MAKVGAALTRPILPSRDARQMGLSYPLRVYRHSPADLITYYMLPRDWRERIPVRTGVGTPQTLFRRFCIRLTARIIPTLPCALIAAGIAVAATESKLPVWGIATAAVSAAVVVMMLMNLYLDPDIMHKVIWLRRARCGPFRRMDETATEFALVEARRKPYLERLAGKPEQSLPGRGAPPYTLLPIRAMRSFTSPTMCVLLPQSVIMVLWFVLSAAATGGLVYMMFGAGEPHLMRNIMIHSVCTSLVMSLYFFRMSAVMQRVLGMAHQKCPHCGHDLSPIAKENLTAGPERCPECGSHWPLVPPPTPAELREIEKQLSSLRAAKQGTTSL